ncbi:uncharacterized protein LOC113294595 [Papaver somniferum]|uniref:uncharacterized protein LOC113294595 n=1 Tax=Papaver somniferum TaxID=3469 RepID=UPI000E6F66C7|nr:uncharacterized protein LOC113294595 [Papaver somniferum]
MMITKWSGKDFFIAQIYVDDIIYGSTSKKLDDGFQNSSCEEFKMSSVGKLRFFLGLRIQQHKNEIYIYQEQYANLVKIFFLEKPTPKLSLMSITGKPQRGEKGDKVDLKLYRFIIGSFLYLIATRPDIAFSGSCCERFQVDPKESHLTTVKRILRCIKHTTGFSLYYIFDTNTELTTYSDADRAGCMEEKKSTTKGFFHVGLNLVAWHSKKQNSLSLSTCEAQYIASGSCYTQLLWMKQMLTDHGTDVETVKIICDSNY